MIGWLLRSLCIATLCLTAGTAAAQAPPSEARFDADAAWLEFDELVRLSYGYFARPGIDGDGILRYFAPLARAAKTRHQFIDVLQLAAHNFADPHFIVGPLDDDDYAVFPTSSDIFAEFEGKEARIHDVRRDSDASGQDIAPRATLLSIDGLEPIVAVEKVMGRPFASLSDPQRNAGLNIALAGTRHHQRHLSVLAGGKPAEYVLSPTNSLADRIQSRPPLTIERRGNVAVIRFENSLGNYATIGALDAALNEVASARTLVIDLRNTPSGGNTTVARAIMGHFVTSERPYQIHTVPREQREYGVPRKYVEFVMPIVPHFGGRLIVLGGHWTGSMGEGLMIGLESFGVPTAGSRLAHLLGAKFDEMLTQSGAKVELGEEQLSDVHGQPRENFLPDLHSEQAEARGGQDLLLDAALRRMSTREIQRPRKRIGTDPQSTE